MDEAEKVLGRLERIRTLERNRASAAVLLGELRELVGEAEAWARLEGDRRALAAVDRLDSALMGAEMIIPRRMSAL